MYVIENWKTQQNNTHTINVIGTLRNPQGIISVNIELLCFPGLLNKMYLIVPFV